MTGKRGAIVALLVLGAWYVSVILWAMNPQVDHVPTGVVDGKQTTQAVTCESPLSSDAGPSNPLPELADGRAYERPACQTVHDNAQRLLFLDTAVIAIGGGCFVIWRLRKTRRATGSVSVPSS